HARLLQAGVADLREHFAERQQAERARKAAELAAADAARAAAERGTLADMLAAYVATLGERPAARDARIMFRLHVADAFPALARQQAATVEPEQARDVLAKLIEAGKGRTAAKLRAYLRAAYATAMRARFDPKTGGAFAAFGVRTNPIEPLPALTEYSRALDRALTLPELRAFWRRLEAQPACAARDFVQCLLLLGGQRPAQLLRVTRADVDLTGGTVTLFDPKGRKRSANPRPHVVPIVAEALPLIERRALLCAGPSAPLFSATGKVALRDGTASRLVRMLVAAMAAAAELEQGPFAMRDLRRTAETHLAALGVSKDVRAHLLSHGISGVQAAHYDRHSYLPEKRAALELWARRLTGKDAPAVVTLPRRRARSRP
ncbi:MAG: tyrosine-type recombinase/integrase, partial [Burkholderiales bacterium]|nr:tyrosine-type recombinase/integrase [Burkholderiales bacterium]